MTGSPPGSLFTFPHATKHHVLRCNVITTIIRYNKRKGSVDLPSTRTQLESFVLLVAKTSAFGQDGKRPPREGSSFHGNARHVASFVVALFASAVQRRTKRITLRVIVSFAVAGQSAICPRGDSRFLDFTRQGTCMVQGRLYARTGTGLILFLERTFALEHFSLDIICVCCTTLSVSLIFTASQVTYLNSIYSRNEDTFGDKYSWVNCVCTWTSATCFQNGRRVHLLSFWKETLKRSRSRSARFHFLIDALNIRRNIEN